MNVFKKNVFFYKSVKTCFLMFFICKLMFLTSMTETTSITITVKTVTETVLKRSSSYTANTLSTLKFAQHKQQCC